MEKDIAIILSGGRGSRFNQDFPKQFYKIAGKTILEHTVDVFNKNSNINEIIIVSDKKFIPKTEEIINKIPTNKKILIIVGGKTRQESSFNALNFLKDKNIKNVIIHDAVRPFLDQDTLNHIINSLKSHNAIDTAIPTADTIIEKERSFIKKIPNRSNLMRGQTPQAFDYNLILSAHEKAKNDKFEDVTDDCGLIYHYNLSKIYIVNGSNENIKITYPIDLSIADEIFRLKQKQSDSLSISSKKDFSEKVSVIYGGFSGIGKETVSELKSLGSKTYPFSRKNGVDITNIKNIRESLKKVYEKEGKIDYIVISSGILDRGLLENQNYEKIVNQINTNYTGSVLVVKEAIPYLKKTNGSIILIGSSSATRGRETYSIYSSTKSALINFVQAMSEELFSYNIKINLISPCRTNTPLRRKNFGKEPINTLLNPNIVAQEISKVLSSNITGQIINIRKN